MKKTIVAIILLSICCTSVFAYNTANNGWWLGPSVCFSVQGVGAAYDFGSFDVGADFAIPLVTGIADIVSDFSWRELASLLLFDELRLSGYYSLVDANWFTFNVGANLQIFNYANYYEDSEGKKEPGWGGACMIMLMPAMQLKFQIANKVSIKTTVNTSFLSFSGANVGGLGTIIPYGNDNAKLGALVICILVPAYNFINLGVQFKL